MQMNDACLPCLVNQMVRVAEMTGASNREALYRRTFAYLSEMDFTKTNPEIIGGAFRLLKEHLQNDDPYRTLRRHYNQLFLKMSDTFEAAINGAERPIELAAKYAILGNMVDFGPMHSIDTQEILDWFVDMERHNLTVNHLDGLLEELTTARSLLYLGDNCGEICLDKLFIKKLRALFPALTIYFGVRGQPVINDSIAEDAVLVGMEQWATIVSNGDDSVGTILSRTSDAFNRVYQSADVVIAKGQANYESLSEVQDKSLYFLLMAKCKVIADHIGVPQKSLICMKNCSQNEPRR